MAAVAVIRGFAEGARQGPPDAERVSVPSNYGPDLFSGGPWPTTAAPWVDVLENPDAPGLPLELVKDPALPRPDIGAQPIVGPFQGYEEHGPVQGWAQEDQNSGRLMRFATNPMHRAPGPGEGSSSDYNSYADEIAAALYANGQGVVTDNEVYDNLLMYR